MAPGLDEFDVIIRSCIVFSQSTIRSDFERTQSVIAGEDVVLEGRLHYPRFLQQRRSR